MWIETTKQLPPEGKYVFGRHNRGTWIDDEDQENVNCVVVKMVKGISKKERKDMSLGIIKEEVVKGWCASEGCTLTPRSKVFRACDEDGNNLVPYNFETFGPTSFFGQEITHWQPIEPL